jgi:hypothetical protein
MYSAHGIYLGALTLIQLTLDLQCACCKCVHSLSRPISEIQSCI